VKQKQEKWKSRTYKKKTDEELNAVMGSDFQRGWNIRNERMKI
jgi:hypothetical protein